MLILWTIDGEECDTQRAVILGAGIDTLYFSFDVEVSEEMWARLEEERLIALLHKQACEAIHSPE